MSATAPACRGCGELLAAGSATDGRSIGPERLHGLSAPAGAVSLCGYCGDITVFTGEGLERRAPTDEELAGIRANPGVARVLAAITAVRRRRRAQLN